MAEDIQTLTSEEFSECAKAVQNLPARRPLLRDHTLSFLQKEQFRYPLAENFFRTTEMVPLDDDDPRLLDDENGDIISFSLKDQRFYLHSYEVDPQILNDFADVFAAQYQMYTILAHAIDVNRLARNFTPADADEVSGLIADQEALIRQMTKMYWQDEFCLDMDDVIEVGISAARRLASAILAGENLTEACSRLDATGVPVCAVVGLAAVQSVINAYLCPYETREERANAIIFAGLIAGLIHGSWGMGSGENDEHLFERGKALLEEVTEDEDEDEGWEVADAVADEIAEAVNALPLDTPDGMAFALRNGIDQKSGIEYVTRIPARFEWNNPSKGNNIIIGNLSDDLLVERLARCVAFGEFSHKATRGCCRKAKYMTYEAVRRSADRQMERKNITLFTYKCSYCGKYHLTHLERFDERINQRNRDEFQRILDEHDVSSPDEALEIWIQFINANRAEILPTVRAQEEGDCETGALRRAA